MILVFFYLKWSFFTVILSKNGKKKFIITYILLIDLETYCQVFVFNSLSPAVTYTLRVALLILDKYNIP